MVHLDLITSAIAKILNLMRATPVTAQFEVGRERKPRIAVPKSIELLRKTVGG